MENQEGGTKAIDEVAAASNGFMTAPAARVNGVQSRDLADAVARGELSQGYALFSTDAGAARIRRMHSVHFWASSDRRPA